MILLGQMLAYFLQLEQYFVKTREICLSQSASLSMLSVLFRRLLLEAAISEREYDLNLPSARKDLGPTLGMISTELEHLHR